MPSAAALPHTSQDKPEAIEQFFELVSASIRTHREDLSCKGYVLPGRTADISVCRIPTEPRPGKPIALFLPDLLSTLPSAAARALAFVDLFDLVLCELPGHGASGEAAKVSLGAFASEFSAVIGTALPRATGLFVIGECLGGLVALALARLRPEQIRSVILIDTPFHLTRPELAAWLGASWRSTGRHPYVRRICREIMGFDPADGRRERSASHHDMVRDARFGCVHITGGGDPSSGITSVVSDADIALLRAANPKMLMPPRVPGCGHAVLLDNPGGAHAVLQPLIKQTLITGKAPVRPATRLPLLSELG
jgi:pimeloyl-ACP methyl ester carboxylesterase